jgi:membrane protein implicated in regulation of membrane protease activity
MKGARIGAVGIVYLAALVLGLGSILVQLFSGGDGDADDHEFHTGGDGDADGHDHAHGSLGFLPIFLSLRFWTFALMTFGIIGTLLRFLKLSDPVTTALLSSGAGLAAGFTAGWLFRALHKAETTSGATSTDAVGQVGRVLIPWSREQRGKVRIELRGQTVDLIATSDEAQLGEGELVLVEEVRGSTLHVSRATQDLLLKS